MTESAAGKATSFGAAADAYERARPTYPAEAVAWLLGESATGTRHSIDIVDVGAGTGKLTRALVGPGRAMTAVDPDAAMLATLAAALPDVPTRVGTAEALPLPDASADLVTLGQAWHWVDAAAASREIARVLRPGGALGLIWNIRDESVPWAAEFGALVEHSKAELYLRDGGPYVGAPFSRGAEDGAALDTFENRWELPFTVDALVDLAASRSHLIAAAPEERAATLAAVRALGDRVVAAEGGIRMPYTTHAFRSIAP